MAVVHFQISMRWLRQLCSRTCQLPTVGGSAPENLLVGRDRRYHSAHRPPLLPQPDQWQRRESRESAVGFASTSLDNRRRKCATEIIYLNLTGVISPLHSLTGLSQFFSFCRSHASTVFVGS